MLLFAGRPLDTRFVFSGSCAKEDSPLKTVPPDHLRKIRPRCAPQIFVRPTLAVLELTNRTPEFGAGTSFCVGIYSVVTPQNIVSAKTLTVRWADRRTTTAESSASSTVSRTIRRVNVKWRDSDTKMVVPTRNSACLPIEHSALGSERLRASKSLCQ